MLYNIHCMVVDYCGCRIVGLEYYDPPLTATKKFFVALHFCIHLFRGYFR